MRGLAKLGMALAWAVNSGSRRVRRFPVLMSIHHVAGLGTARLCNALQRSVLAIQGLA